VVLRQNASTWAAEAANVIPDYLDHSHFSDEERDVLVHRHCERALAVLLDLPNDVIDKLEPRVGQLFQANAVFVVEDENVALSFEASLAAAVSVTRVAIIVAVVLDEEEIDETLSD
jgi:hypothetical protein